MKIYKKGMNDTAIQFLRMNYKNKMPKIYSNNRVFHLEEYLTESARSCMIWQMKF